jgi:hypothetical protein
MWFLSPHRNQHHPTVSHPPRPHDSPLLAPTLRALTRETRCLTMSLFRGRSLDVGGLTMGHNRPHAREPSPSTESTFHARIVRRHAMDPPDRSAFHRRDPSVVMSSVSSSSSASSLSVPPAPPPAVELNARQRALLLSRKHRELIQLQQQQQQQEESTATLPLQAISNQSSVQEHRSKPSGHNTPVAARAAVSTPQQQQPPPQHLGPVLGSVLDKQRLRERFRVKQREKLGVTESSSSSNLDSLQSRSNPTESIAGSSSAVSEQQRMALRSILGRRLGTGTRKPTAASDEAGPKSAQPQQFRIPNTSAKQLAATIHSNRDTRTQQYREERPFVDPITDHERHDVPPLAVPDGYAQFSSILQDEVSGQHTLVRLSEFSFSTYPSMVDF